MTITEKKLISAKLLKDNANIIFQSICQFLNKYPRTYNNIPFIEFQNKQEFPNAFDLFTIEDIDHKLANLLDMFGLDAIMTLFNKYPISISHRYHQNYKFITLNVKRANTKRTEIDKIIEYDNFQKYSPNIIFPTFNVHTNVDKFLNAKQITLTTNEQLNQFYMQNRYRLQVDTNDMDDSTYINISRKTAEKWNLPLITTML